MPTADSLLTRAKGRSLTSISKQGIGAWLLAVSSSAILGVQEVTRLLLLPVRLMVKITDSVVDALLLKPLTIVISGSEATAASVAQFELFGLPLGTGIVLFTFGMIAWYLKRPSTSDFIPGTFTDFGGDLVGVEEEADQG